MKRTEFKFSFGIYLNEIELKINIQQIFEKNIENTRDLRKDI